jgi:hypothetical protein
MGLFGGYTYVETFLISSTSEKCPDHHSSLCNCRVGQEGRGVRPLCIHIQYTAGRRKGYVFKEFNTEAQWNALLQIEINKKCVQSISVPLISSYLLKINTIRQSTSIPLECHNTFCLTQCRQFQESSISTYNKKIIT